MKADAAAAGRLLTGLAAVLLLLPATLQAQPILQSSSPALPVSPASSDAIDAPPSRPRLANPANQVLPAAEAFALTSILEGDSQVLLSWSIAPGYYLYRDKLAVLAAPAQTLTLALPAAQAVTDEYFGDTFVYFDAVALRLPAAPLATADGTIRLEIHFQGCAKDRYCYPPQQTTVELRLPR